MKRTIIAATAAALVASVTFGIAAPELRSNERPRPSPEQMAEFASAMSDARIAALHTGLRLSPEQEKLWPALEAGLKDFSQQRIERRLERREQRAERARQGGNERPDVLDRMRDRADGMMERGETLKKLVDAADPLYQTLDDGQKRRFAILFRPAGGHRFAQGEHRGPKGPHRFGSEHGGPKHQQPVPAPGGERL